MPNYVRNCIYIYSADYVKYPPQVILNQRNGNGKIEPGTQSDGGRKSRSTPRHLYPANP